MVKNKILKNMVYGVIGVSVDFSMLNAGMDKRAKQNSIGDMYVSPQSTGYAIKQQLLRDSEGKVVEKKDSENIEYKDNILYIRAENTEGVMTLKDNLESKVEFQPKKDTTIAQVQKVLFEEFIDIRLFGTTFTVGGNWGSFGITGPLQIGFGVNKFKETEEIISNMLPSFSKADSKVDSKTDSKKDDEKKLKNNTLGEQLILDKANFVQDWTLCPYQYDKYVGVIEGFEGFLREDYEKFKKASMKAISNLNTKAKKGCKNEFSLFVEMKEEIRDNIDLNSMTDYITIDRNEDSGKTIYNLEKLIELLEEVKEDIENIEIYFDNKKIKIIGELNIVNSVFNIITKKKIDEVK